MKLRMRIRAMIQEVNAAETRSTHSGESVLRFMFLRTCLYLSCWSLIYYQSEYYIRLYQHCQTSAYNPQLRLASPAFQPQ